MNDELDPEVFGDLPEPGDPDLGAEMSEGEVSDEAASGGLYPFIQGLGGSEYGGTYLCQDPLTQSGQVVQKQFSEEITQEKLDWVEVGMKQLQAAAHPHLALVRDFGYEGGQAFLVREYVPGSALLPAMRQASPEQILMVFHQILGALDYLFQEGLHHLRLSPGNLFWTTDARGQGQVKISDFGIGAYLDKKTPAQTQTVGVPPYTAPEYAMNPYPDTRADLYSVGVLLFQCLTNKLPFSGSDPVKIMEQQLSQDPPPVGDFISAPKGLNEFVAGLTHRDPMSRFRDPREALLALTALIKNHLSELRAPPIFSGPEETFYFKKYAKLFRRIVLQGRRWAFRGPRGSGKTYFARWVQRYFWINRKDVRFYKGEELLNAKGESILHPTEPLFVIIDDADDPEVEAWLETKPYQHVVLFGKELKWAESDSRWQFFELEPLSLEATVPLYQEQMEGVVEGDIQTLYRGHQGRPGPLVELARSWQDQGNLPWRGKAYDFQNAGLETLVKQQSKGLSPTLLTSPLEFRSALTLLALGKVPLSCANLKDLTGLEEPTLRGILIEACVKQVLRRQLWMGQEYFHWDTQEVKVLDEEVASDQLERWCEGLTGLDWYEGALNLIQGALGAKRIGADSSWQLKWVSWAAACGRYGDVMNRVTGPWVKGLEPLGQAIAFEALGQALVANQKGESALKAFKNAFTQYRSVEDLPGQTRILAQLGEWYLDQGDQGQALKFLEQGMSFAEKLKSSHPQLLGRLQRGVAQLYEAATDYEQGETYYQQSVDTLFSAQRYRELASTYQAMAGLYLKTGQPDQAESYAQEALTLARFKKAYFAEGQALMVLADLEEQRGHLVWVQERLQQAVASLKRAKRVLPYGKSLIKRAYFFENNRQLDRAAEDAKEALNLANKTGSQELLGQAHLVKGKVLRRDLDKLAEAKREFQAAQKIYGQKQQLQFSWECEFELGEIERNLGNLDQARQHYELALKQVDDYVAGVTPQVHEAFLKDGKRDRIEMAMKWLD